MTQAPGSKVATPAPMRALALGDARRTVAGARFEVDHWHEDIEFNLVVKGGGSYVLDERSHVLKPGTLVWLVPGQRHRLQRSPGLEMWVVAVRAHLLDQDTLAVLAAQPARQLPGEDLLDLDRLLSQVAQDSDEPAVYDAGIAYALQRAVRASRDRPPAALREMHPAVARSLLVLRRRGAEVSLSELASAASVTAPYLSRLLVEHTGRSFVDWRNRVRLDRFIAAYRPGANLLDIALGAGFGSYARFSAVFNELVGCGPGEWARNADAGAPAPAAGLPALEPIDWGVGSAEMPADQRQRWLALVPWVDETLRALTGHGFLERLLTSPQRTGAMHEDASATVSDEGGAAARAGLIAGLRQQQPSLADTLGRLLELHDFAAYCAHASKDYRRSAARIDDMLTGFIAATWTAVHGSSYPTLAQVDALHAQTRTALGSRLSELGEPARRQLHAALQCHFMIMNKALEAARASTEPRALKALGEAARACARLAFGDDLSSLEFGAQGLARPRPPAAQQAFDAAAVQPRRR